MEKIKKTLKAKYEMSDVGEAKTFLGIQIKRNRQRGTVTLYQSASIKTILTRYGIDQYNPTKIPIKRNLTVDDGELLTGDAIRWYQQLNGQFMYLIVCTRPDLAYVVGQLAKYNSRPTTVHAEAARKVLRYLSGTKSLGLTLGRNQDGDQQENLLLGYSDSDLTGDLDDRKSTGRHLWFLNKNLIIWKSKKQTIVADSTWHAEYIAASEAAKDAIWLERLIKTAGIQLRKPPILRLDCTATQSLITNPKQHNRTKHVDIKYHLIRDIYTKRKLQIERVPSADNPADDLTKPLAKLKHQEHVTTIGLRLL
ncbi:uncharacterized protein DFL_001423 [Arthrobotrys flagrans]|uniref:Reverse transcriptase Ty1/copia-type domain-containing protein n=1 Tax=Arthrobotrys flagrans TaxID=97331 RepID=A0A437A8D6_ARTFL|nr:hypothetical protein DFL_001423 [Arthrobotrys flagrans]